MKKLVPARANGAGTKKKIPVRVGVKMDANLSIDRDCVCKTMDTVHCPIHAVKKIPAPGQDVIR